MLSDKEKQLAEMFNGVTPDQVWMVGNALDYCHFMQRHANVTAQELEIYYALARSGEADRYLQKSSMKMRTADIERCAARRNLGSTGENRP
jgi:hypothetical protein